jgi:hypothetical protein
MKQVEVEVEASTLGLGRMWRFLLGRWVVDWVVEMEDGGHVVRSRPLYI